MASQKNHKFNAPIAIFIGPQRAGTSWLHRYFSQRDDICLPKDVKELFFFDQNFERGPDFYFSHFHEEDHHKLIMEVSATYFADPDAPKRIYEYFGKDIKLVCPLRHPVTRSYSLYHHFLRYGLVTGNIKQAYTQKPDIISTSYYTEHLQSWLRYFDKEQIHICFQEDLAKDQNQFMTTLCEFLGIEFTKIPEKTRGYYNAGTKPPIQIIANWAQKFASFLRSIRLYGIINIAKKMGLKQFIFGTEKSKSHSDDIPRPERVFIQRKLSREIKKLEEFLGHKITVWNK